MYPPFACTSRVPPVLLGMTGRMAMIRLYREYIEMNETRKTQIDLETEGFGLADQVLPAERLFVPPLIEVEGEMLIYERAGPAGVFQREVEPEEQMIWQFIELAEAEPEAILKFARRWGVLGICPHLLPTSHNPPPLNAAGNGPVTWCYPLGYFEGGTWEPLAIWRTFAAQARAMILVSRQLHLGQPGTVEDWRVIYARSGREAPWWQRDVEADRAILARVLEEWLILGNVRLRVRWDGKAPTVGIGGGLFGALAAQLLGVVSGTTQFEICSACGKTYKPERRPRAGRRYCPECRAAGRPAADANRDARARKKAAKPS